MIARPQSTQKRSISETMVQQPRQIRDGNLPSTKKGRQVDSYEGISFANNNRTDTISCTTTSSKTQHNIAKIIQRLQDYASGSNERFQFCSIRKHSEGIFKPIWERRHLQSTQTILKYCTAAGKNGNPTSCNRDQILQDYFPRPLYREEPILLYRPFSSLERRTANCKISKSQPPNCTSTTRNDESGLSGTMYMHIVQACLAEIEKVKPMDDKDVASHSEIFLSILLALTKALSNEKLLPEHSVVATKRQLGSILSNDQPFSASVSRAASQRHGERKTGLLRSRRKIRRVVVILH